MSRPIWFSKIASYWNADTSVYLAECYLTGHRNVEVDNELALHYFQRGALLGFGDNQPSLYPWKNAGLLLESKGNLDEVIKWYQLAMNHGISDGQLWTANFLAKTRKFDEAIKLYSPLALNNDPRAALGLYRVYRLNRLDDLAYYWLMRLSVITVNQEDFIQNELKDFEKPKNAVDIDKMAYKFN